MPKQPYFEYFKMNDAKCTQWLNLSVANGSLYYSVPVRIGTWGVAMGVISSSTQTITAFFQYSHDGTTFITPTAQNVSEYSTLVKSISGSLWNEVNFLGAASWIRLAVGGGGASAATTFILNRVEEL